MMAGIVDEHGAALEPDDSDFDEQAYYVERLDGLRIQALGMANSYAAHREESMTPSQIVEYARAYADFLLGNHSGSVQ